MESGDIVFVLVGIGVGLMLSLLLWRSRLLGDQYSADLKEQVDTYRQRLDRSEEQRAANESAIDELEAQLAGDGIAGLADLPSDDARIATLSKRLTQSQLWLEESELRAAELASKLDERDAVINETRQSLEQVKQHAERASQEMSGVIDLRDDVAHGAGGPGPLSTGQMLSLRQAELTALRRKVEAIEGGVDARHAEADHRLSELEAELAEARAALACIGDAPERAAHLQDEVSRLRALVADHSVDRDRLGSQLSQRDTIDNKLDALFVEIHELRGRSAALRRGAANPASDQLG